MNISSDDTSGVNTHFLDHVVTCAEASGVEASEDILASNGMKLLAKGAKVDARVRERLLDYKLRKPLESTLRVVDGVATRRIDRLAEELMDGHPLLSRLCGQASGKLLTAQMRGVILSTEVDTLLSVYAAQGEGKLQHAVGVALLGAALVREVTQGDDGHLMLADLVHDVGELYIDPAYLQPGRRLDTQQWKHVATHPLVGAKVLSAMPGAGPQVARSVLHHHERQDGFGYPNGLAGSEVSLGGQVLAVSELLMGLLVSKSAHAHRATVALKLMPGEFNRSLLDRVVTASRDLLSAEDDGGLAVEAARLAQDIGLLRAKLELAAAVRARLLADTRLRAAPVAKLVHAALERADRIRAALSSTGLDSFEPEQLAQELALLAPSSRLETSIAVRELGWRMADLERQTTLRADRLGPAEGQEMRRLFEGSLAQLAGAAAG